MRSYVVLFHSVEVISCSFRDLLPCLCGLVFQLWIQERIPMATSIEHGHNLQTVQLLIKKNQVKGRRSGFET